MSDHKADKSQPQIGGNVVPLGTGIGDLCSIVTFATSSGIPVSEVVELVESGTLPSVRVSDCLMVNVRQLRHDLLNGKAEFKEGDYSHD
ncbi:hypothetical protein V0R48_03275 [Pseudomonas alcaligenes]|uniref:hypothetical protein n=1 Tax=Aquipseudomonas alcaligenes TaxID=43263 RepID=UPI002E7AB814|nr:hypothetical protein [Pseudomonas alcaligenes]MEE1947980.1 hypothetical protein [Pseudomonas alcaligenes]